MQLTPLLCLFISHPAYKLLLLLKFLLFEFLVELKSLCLFLYKYITRPSGGRISMEIIMLNRTILC